jgi:hypothetical protein
MEKLQWFKFAPSDYMMGKIQRCPEITQARFIRLCCLYWNKQCELSYIDAEIEIDKEHLDILTAKKIVKVVSESINIDFLDEQMKEILETAKGKSKAANARWAKYKQQQENAMQNDTDVMHVHTDAMQNDADKNRTDEIRQEEIREEEEKKFNFRSALVSLGVSNNLVKDWLQVRKTKKAANTETAFNALKKEIQKSGLSADKCLLLAVENSWAGFKAEWVKDKIEQEVGSNGLRPAPIQSVI